MIKSQINQEPIFLIGTHRSGTTWLGTLFEALDGISYWPEPRQVWSYKNWHKPDDLLTSCDASVNIKEYIKQRFSKYVISNSGTRFCEKTPSNCLRIPFMYSIYPNGKFILIIRDGRAVYRSTREIRLKGPDWKRIWIRINESSIEELPAYFGRCHLEKIKPIMMRTMVKLGYKW